MKTSWNSFKEKWIWKKPAVGPHRYYSVDDLQASLRLKDAFLQEMLMDIWYGAKRLWERPGDICRDIKWRYQRSVRGWSDRDVWGMHNHLSNVIVDMCKDLKEHKMGYPMSMLLSREDNDFTDAEDTAASEKWDSILSEIIWTFETAQKISDSDWMYPGDFVAYNEHELEAKAKYATSNHLKDMHWMTSEELARYNQGWDYLKKFFFSLWD